MVIRFCGEYRIYLMLVSDSDYAVRITRCGRMVHTCTIEYPCLVERPPDDPINYDIAASMAMSDFEAESTEFDASVSAIRADEKWEILRKRGHL